MKILITGGKSAQAFKLLREFKEDDIIMADYGEMPHFPSKEYQFISMGIQNPETTAHSLLTFCLDNAVNAIVPVYDFEIEALAKSNILFEEFEIQIIRFDGI